MSSTTQQHNGNPQHPERTFGKPVEKFMSDNVRGVNDSEQVALEAKIQSGRDTFAGKEIIGAEAGENVTSETHPAHVTVDHVRTMLWKGVEETFKRNDAAQAEKLVEEITGKHPEAGEAAEHEDETNGLSQEERLAQAETQLKKFFDKLAKELTPLINADQAELLERDSVGDRITRQLGEKGDVNIALANQAVARTMVEAFQKNGMELSGYERAFNDKTREGFVLENKESGLRFMFIYDQAMPKAQERTKPEAPVAKPDEANAQMPDQAAPEHTTEAAADSKHEVKDRTVAAKRAAAAQQQAANDPPEIEALFGSGAAQAAQQQAANERPTEDDKKKSA